MCDRWLVRPVWGPKGTNVRWTYNFQEGGGVPGLEKTQRTAALRVAFLFVEQQRSEDSSEKSSFKHSA